MIEVLAHGLQYLLSVPKVNCWVEFSEVKREYDVKENAHGFTRFN